MDEYRVIGPPSGTPVVITAQLAAIGDGMRICWKYTDCSMGYWRIGLQQEYADRVEASSVFDSSLVLQHPIAAISDQPFPLTIYADVGTQTVRSFLSTAAAMATLSFADLPPGARVVSCGGYDSGSPTPASKMSWGRLKLLYR